MWKGLVAVGGRSSVVRALAAQASDLGSIPGSFPILFHIPFSACVSINTLLIQSSWLYSLDSEFQKIEVDCSIQQGLTMSYQ